MCVVFAVAIFIGQIFQILEFMEELRTSWNSDSSTSLEGKTNGAKQLIAANGWFEISHHTISWTRTYRQHPAHSHSSGNTNFMKMTSVLLERLTSYGK